MRIYKLNMPWRASSVMEEKLRFVFEYERDEHSMTDLCSQFGIARETGYVWLRRYRQYGVQGLAELNRAPRLHPNQTPVRIEQAVLELRQAHMTWGPRKLKRVLERDQPAGPGVAGHQHHRRGGEAGRAGGSAQEAATDRAL